MSRFAIFTEAHRNAEIILNVDRVLFAFPSEIRGTKTVNIIVPDPADEHGVLDYQVIGTMRDVVKRLNGQEE